MKLVFFGTPAFAVPVLRAVYEAGHTVLAVVTQPDRPKGRKKTLCPPEVKVCAEALGLPVLQFEKIKSPEAMQALSDLQADCWVTAAYGQQKEPIRPEDTTESLLARLSEIAAPLMVQTLCLVEQGRAPRTPQNSEEASRHPMLSKQDGLLDFSLPAQAVFNKTRGVTPWPGAFSTLAGQTYKFTEPYLAKGSGEPGQILLADAKKGFVIACGKDAVGFGKIQAPGKKMMPVADFLRGHALDANGRFGQ